MLSNLPSLFTRLNGYWQHIIIRIKGGAVLDELLTTEEIAKELKYHIETVRKWIREGKLKAMRINRKEYRVKRSELERFLAEKQEDETD
jgi:excisionase family DNA binding protein